MKWSLGSVQFPELKLDTGQPPRPPVFVNDRTVFAKDSINFLLAQNCPSYPDIVGLVVVVAVLLFIVNTLTELHCNTPNSWITAKKNRVEMTGKKVV